MEKIVVIGTGRMGGAFPTAFAERTHGVDPRIARGSSSTAALTRQLGVRVPTDRASETALRCALM